MIEKSEWVNAIVDLCPAAYLSHKWSIRMEADGSALFGCHRSGHVVRVGPPVSALDEGVWHEVHVVPNGKLRSFVCFEGFRTPGLMSAKIRGASIERFIMEQLRPADDVMRDRKGAPCGWMAAPALAATPDAPDYVRALEVTARELQARFAASSQAIAGLRDALALVAEDDAALLRERIHGGADVEQSIALAERLADSLRALRDHQVPR